ncbi:isomerase [Pseudoalteromonas rubra]|uniref:Isomerase n=1 Tax=Pseudoalteromonas rubra TaxID=43658 RepID=A0A5S3WTI2_9GAMM|nr:PhzF family phenazine biosynthesis protein [Pseudoalteromonas rubra]TMP30274.1 isomerase [Pseudoalteromonas rubra]TMP31951.1 isomerase [Pseudoalteromonas rubra]
MKLDIFQVDAFASAVFEGNPAAVCPLPSWLPDDLLQKIAEENNLSETAFFVSAENTYQLRWFTPKGEVDLCGHATLATAHVLFTHLGFHDQTVQFQTRSGLLSVTKLPEGYSMDFPATPPHPVDPPENILVGLGVSSVEAVLAGFDYLVVLSHESEVKAVSPDFEKLAQLDLRGVVVTARGDSVDFVSRCFYPKLRVNEDPVTGSAHCQLAPYWCERLDKNKLTAQQLSERTGKIKCTLVEGRVILEGNAVDYLQGQISI